MSQANKYPNYKPVNEALLARYEKRLFDLIQDAERDGLVLDIEHHYYDVAMGHIIMRPHVRGARTLSYEKAANRAMAAAGIDPLLLVPIHAQSPSNCYCLDDTKTTRLRDWFRGNGFTVATMEQLVDACYSANLNPRGFDHFKDTQHAITLPHPL